MDNKILLASAQLEVNLKERTRNNWCWLSADKYIEIDEWPQKEDDMCSGLTHTY